MCQIIAFYVLLFVCLLTDMSEPQLLQCHLYSQVSEVMKCNQHFIASPLKPNLHPLYQLLSQLIKLQVTSGKSCHLQILHHWPQDHSDFSRQQRQHTTTTAQYCSLTPPYTSTYQQLLSILTNEVSHLPIKTLSSISPPLSIIQSNYTPKTFSFAPHSSYLIWKWIWCCTYCESRWKESQLNA